MMTSISRPQKLDKEIEQVIKFKKQGDYKEALITAQRLIIEYPDIASVYGMIASIYFELDRFNESSQNYKKAVELSPKSEMASLGLFHSLWQLGDIDEAFEETKRYMAIAVKDY